jgi:hypothetical protein
MKEQILMKKTECIFKISEQNFSKAISKLHRFRLQYAEESKPNAYIFDKLPKRVSIKVILCIF